MLAGRPAAAMLGAALCVALASVASAQNMPTPEQTPYINGFCLGVVAGSSGPEGLKERLQAFGGRPVSSGAVDAAKPVDVDISGQLFHFPEANAPVAFVEPRRGTCSLVYGAAQVPGAAMTEIQTGRLPVGPSNALVGWRPVAQYLAGRPRPPKFYLQFGEAGGYGVCAEINNDLRRRDQSPVSVVALYGCRIGTDERLG